MGLPSVNDLVILGEKIDVTYHKITNDSEQFAKQSSGWSLYRIVDLRIFPGKYKPIKGGTAPFITIPDRLKNSKYKIWNIKSDDNCCFKWAVIAGYMENRLSTITRHHDARMLPFLRANQHTLDWTGLDWPTPIQSNRSVEHVIKSNRKH